MNQYEVTIVRVGERFIAVLAEEADGVERAVRPTPLPHAPAAVLGVIGVRGRILTLLDTLALLGETRAGAMNETHAFILALRGDEQLALAVDGTERVREIPVAAVSPPGEALANIAHGIFQDEEATVILLDVTRLFEAATAGMQKRRRERSLTK